MANKIQLRRDTAANWTRVNPILDDGEPGVETDTNKVKYGDGNTTWISLEYASGGLSLEYAGFQEGPGVMSGNVTSLTGSVGTSLSLTADGYSQMMWVPDASAVTINEIDAGGNVYNWAYVDDSGFTVASADFPDSYEWSFDTTGNLTLPPSGDILIDGGTNSAIRDILQNDVHTGADHYTLVLSDRGKMIYQTGGYNVIVPAADGSTITFPVGTVITVVNSGGAGDLNIVAADGGTNTDIYGAGTDTNSYVWALPSNSIASLMKVEASGAYSKWLLSGAGIYDNS